ncbi:DUF302 domain-containing protein [Peribacillus frigoritolerans]|uniref:DUF302 domain-containing protein n=1 Tax=Peribacillus frigoritolerans TaxID=450367 RepID=UPI003871D546
MLEVCNPLEAARVLEINKLVGYFLPCKVTVYENNGTTKIGLPRPTMMIEMIEDQDLNDIAKDIEETYIKLLDISK